jgi:putative ABC transport system permease protein
LRSQWGLLLRAFGSNQSLLSVLGHSTEFYRSLGLSISNACAALSGALAAQINGFADINMGLGVSLIGIGAVVIGRQLIIGRKESFYLLKELFSCFLGILTYFSCMSILLRIGINPINLKFILGLVLFFALRGFKP